MAHIIGQWTDLGWTAAKALLLFGVGVIGLRLSERRMLAELNAFDFVVAVAVGAIIGRTATSSTTSFATGAVGLIVLLVAHRATAILHRRGCFARLLDRRPLILLARGRIRSDALRAAGLTERDVYRLLRQAGHGDVEELQYVLYEDRGRLTIVRTDQHLGEAFRIGLAEANSNAAE